MDPNSKPSVVKVSINNKIFQIDLASESRDAYDDMNDKITYLGRGLYFSINGVRNRDPKYTHFWKFKKEKNKTMKKITVGGKRKNSGRKKVADPKKQISLFINESKIEERGGMEATKTYLYGCL